MDFFSWVSKGDNYKSSFQTSWGANAKRRRRQQAEAQRATMERQARAAATARAEAAEAAANAARGRRGSWSGADASRPLGTSRGRVTGDAAATSGRRGNGGKRTSKNTIDGFAPVRRIFLMPSYFFVSLPRGSTTHCPVTYQLSSLLPLSRRRMS